MTRSMTIKWLRWIQNMFPQDSEQYKALEQALSDVEKIDQIEQIMKKASYVEDGKVYTYLHNEEQRLDHIQEVLGIE